MVGGDCLQHCSWSWGDHLQFHRWSGGTKYSAVDGPGAPFLFIFLFLFIFILIIFFFWGGEYDSYIATFKC